MKKKKYLAAGAFLCAVSGLLCACGNTRPDLHSRIQVGVACYNQSDTFISELTDCFKEQLGLLENQGMTATVILKDAAGSQRTQDDQVKELIDGGCNVLCVNLVDRTDPSEIIDLARDHEVPIIFFNREPVAEDLMQWSGLYYVGADAEQSGVMQGELAADVIKADRRIDKDGDGKIQYVVLEGEAGHQDAIIRTEKVADTLKSQGIQLEKLSYGVANWNRAQAENRMTQMIGQHQNRIELVLANNDDMALGAIDAYTKLNITQSTFPVFFGIDGTEEGLKAVVDSKMAGTVYNDKEGQAEAMAKLAAALVSGEGMDEIPFEDEKFIYLPYEKITKDNAESFLDGRQEMTDRRKTQ